MQKDNEPIDPQRCPTCGQPVQARESTLERLVRWCGSAGRHVYPSGTVEKEVAAEILGVSLGTLSNWRTAQTGPPYHKHGKTGRVRYALADLADHLDNAARHDTAQHG